MTERCYEQLLAGRVDERWVDPLVRYAELLERWSGRHNLVRVAGRAELVERHLLDALAGVELVAGTGRLLDVGSGAGLPGVPLLIAAPAWSGVLLEPRQKRWAFLKRVVRELGLPAEVRAERYEQHEDSGCYDLITARAVGAHEELLRWARERLRPGGGVAFWTTDDTAARLSQIAGWRVLSWPLVHLERGRLVLLAAERPCST